MASTTQQVNLVSSREADAALLLDPAFINAWGLALRPAGAGGHWWIANTDTSRVTLYVGDSPTVPFGQDGLSVIGVPGAADGTPVNIIVDPPSQGGVPLPPPDPTPLTVMPPSNPTGQVFSGSNSDFLVSGTSLTGAPLANAPARFITVSEDGTIAAWGETGSAPGQRMNAFSVVVDNSDSGAIYKGVTVSDDGGSGNLLYAANFSQNHIDVFDAQWQPVATIDFVAEAPGGRDISEFSPFNIERVHDAGLGRDVLMVAYAKVANAAGGEEESTDGFIAKFDLDGTFILASDAGGLFNAPWGFALAPSNYGPYSDMLLVGNFGDGSILALDMESMEPEGYVLDTDGRPVSIDGLWDLAFGNGASLGRSDSLYFTAGPEEESHGLFGSLSVDVGDDAAGYFRGTSANDVHSGASGDDVIKGRGGDDTLMGQLGADYIDGAKGNDTIFGGSGDDVVEGSTGSDRLFGGGGNDRIKGGQGADELAGGAGHDRLFGASGDDALAGGAGNDFLDGGAGEDVFVFDYNFGNDHIAHFDANPRGGQDLIDLRAFGLTAATFEGQVDIALAGCDTIISVDGGGAITLLDFQRVHVLSQDDFIL